jgi:dimethylargininase
VSQPGHGRLLALTRAVSPTLDQCQLTHQTRQPIDVARAVAQHAGYEDALRSAGVEVVRIPAAPDLPDAVFVEDTAVVLDEVAILTNPGAASRRPEVTSVAGVLGTFRRLVRVEPPATLDGGDVLVVGRTIYVGQSSRSNKVSVHRVRDLVGPLGYAVHAVEVKGALHLKSAVTAIGPGRLLLNPQWVNREDFRDHEVCLIDPAEPGAANAVLVNDRIIYPTHYPRTAARLESEGLQVIAVEVSELAKAEGGVTCCSLILMIADAPLLVGPTVPGVLD